MLLLLLSILILGTGPLLFGVVSRFGQARSVIDGFVIFAVGGLILVHVLPQTIEAGGGWAMVAGVVGLFLPMAFERMKSLGHQSVHAMVFGGAVTFLILHALFDGIALGNGAQEGGKLALSLAVLLHRLPVALMIWWLLSPEYGKRVASAALASVGIATLAGFLLEGQLHHLFDGAGFACLQAFVAGSLLHVIAHQNGHDDHGHGHGHAHDHDQAPAHPRWEALGALVGVGLVALLPVLESWYVAGHMSHTGHAQRSSMLAVGGYGHRLLDLFLESAPALLLGYVLAGVFVAWLPIASLKWMSKGRGLSQALRGTLFGLPIPICSCGVVPLYQTLIQRGVPASAALAFLVATPELGIEALIISIPLLGLKLTLARLIAALGVAIVVGWGLGALFGRMKQGLGTHQKVAGGDVFSDRPTGWRAKLREARRFGLVEVVDDTAAWIVTGLAIAALFSPDILPGFFADLPPHADVVCFALLGLPLYVCASGATPLAAAIIFAGASPGAAVAFLLAGPASNVTTLGILSKMHGKPQAWVFGLSVVVLAIVLGVGVNAVLGLAYAVPLAAAHHEDTHGVLHICAALGLCGVFLASILRHGPRSWIHTVLSLGAHHTHADLDHTDCCGTHAGPGDQGSRPSLALRPKGPASRMPVVKLPVGPRPPHGDGNV